MESYYPAHGAFARPVEHEGRSYRVGVVLRALRAGRWQLVREEPHPLMDVSDERYDELPPEVLAKVTGERLLDWNRPGAGDQSARHPKIAAALRAALDAEQAREGDRRAALPARRRDPVAPAEPRIR